MSYCVRWTTWLLALAGCIVVGHGTAAYGQSAEERGSASFATETTTNLFAAPGSSAPVDGWAVQMPSGWVLDQAVVLRYGSERIPVEVQRTEGASDAYTVVAARAQRGPFELILRTQTGPTSGRATWSVVPFSYGPMGYREVQEAHRVTRHVDVAEASGALPNRASENRALAFRASAPLLLRRDPLPRLASDADFTVEFWVKTTGLEEVVLSTWTGDENEPYSLEVVIDASGRLRYYCGRRGQHQSITTRTPIADGRWHHVAVVHRAAQQRVVLFHEGAPVDSLRRLSLPANSGPSLALGGRVPGRVPGRGPGRGMGTQGTTPRQAYSGQLDEVRFWGSVRSAPVMRRVARRMIAAAPSAEDVRLGFDEVPPARLLASSASTIELVPSDLHFNPSLRDLHAVAEGGTIHLTWEATNSQTEAFVIERSVEGKPFQVAGRVHSRSAGGAGDGTAAHYEFSDAKVSGQVVYYRIRQQHADGTERLSGTLKIGRGAPEQRGPALIGNFPNPFSETTTIAYEVRETQPVRLTVWNLSGHQVATLVDDTHTPGYYEQTFRVDNLPSGTYFVRLRTPRGTVSHKMVLLK